MNFRERMKEITDYTFCYAKEGGAGFIHKDQCKCGIGAENKCCDEKKDHQRFVDRFNDFADTDKTRNEIIQIIKPEFKDSQWWRNNVVE